MRDGNGFNEGEKKKNVGYTYYSLPYLKLLNLFKGLLR